MNRRAGFTILLFVAFLLIVSSVSVKVTAQSNEAGSSSPSTKETSAGECPPGEIKGSAGCFKVQPITIPPPEKSLKSTSAPRTITIPAPNECTKPPCTVTVHAPKEKYATPMLGGAILGGENPHSLKNLIEAGANALKNLRTPKDLPICEKLSQGVASASSLQPKCRLAEKGESGITKEDVLRYYDAHEAAAKQRTCNLLRTKCR